jgi:hypothetical protein
LRKSLTKTEEEPVKQMIDEPQRDSIRDNYIRESKIMLLASLLYKKIKNYEDVAGLFKNNDELTELYNFLVARLNENKDFNASTLFDNFNINSNSLIDKVINYVFPSEDVFENYLLDTIKRVKIYELEIERARIQRALLNSTTDQEKYDYLNQLQAITKLISKEK